MRLYENVGAVVGLCRRSSSGATLASNMVQTIAGKFKTRWLAPLEENL